MAPKKIGAKAKMRAKAQAFAQESMDNAAKAVEEEEAPKPRGRLFMIPRDAPRSLAVEVQEGNKEIQVTPVGPDFGTVGGKFVAYARPQEEVSPNSYILPYNYNRTCELDPEAPDIDEVGDDLADLTAKYAAGQTALNHPAKMYCPPCSGMRVLEIDTRKGTVQEIGPTLGDRGIRKYMCIAVSQMSGRLYAAPYDAQRVIEIDPNARSSDKAVREIGPNLGKMRGKYCCMCVATNGNMYAPPFNATQVLMITPRGDVSLTGPNLGTEVTKKYCSILCAPNRLLYAPPLYADKVLEINPAQGRCMELGMTGPDGEEWDIGVGEAKYASCCVCPYNNKVYAAPLEARRILQIDCEYHEVTQIGLDLGPTPEKYSDIAPAPVGRMMYAVPRDERKLLEIDPEREYVREVGPDFGGARRKFSCIITGNGALPEVIVPKPQTPPLPGAGPPKKDKVIKAFAKPEKKNDVVTPAPEPSSEAGPLPTPLDPEPTSEGGGSLPTREPQPY